jgi:hypothetical protein
VSQITEKLSGCANFMHPYFHSIFSHVRAIPVASTIWQYGTDAFTAILS